MDIMELGAIGELVGGVAVVASLIYVGLQVRQSNRQSRDAAALEVTNQYDRLMQTVISDPKARELFMIASGGGAQRLPLGNPANLDPDDLQIFVALMARTWHQFESHYRAWRSGALEEEQWSKVVPFIRFTLGGAPGLDYWKAARQGWHGKDFTVFVDMEMAAVTREAA